MPRQTGSEKLRAPLPARVRTRRISSVAYALDDSGSEAKTARATVLLSRSCRAWASGIGAPTSNRFSRVMRMPQVTLPAPAAGEASGEKFNGFLTRPLRSEEHTSELQSP